MKILITGANSYIGTSFENYMKQFEDYEIDIIDMIDGSWREKDFSGYDTVFHVAGIAHVKETKENAHLYFRINRDLAIETAQRAKQSRVKQFILLSSMSVYGLTSGKIDFDTSPNPKSNYGRSKLEADNAIAGLSDDSFKVAIVRPPMVYGKGCKGNYCKLSKFAKTIYIFPKYKNERSMIYIDNLCEFIKRIIENLDCGTFYPQNEEFICTSDMVYQIALCSGKRLKLISIFNWALMILKYFGVFSKLFGNLYYEKEMSKYKENYCIINNYDSICISEE